MSNRIRLSAVAVSCLCLFLLPLCRVGAGETRTPSPAKGRQQATVDQLNTAYGLIAYGRRAKDPVALLLAARILHQSPTRPIRELVGAGKDRAELAKKVVKDSDDNNSPMSLVAEAKALGGKPHVAKLIQQVSALIKERPRGINKGMRNPALRHGPFSNVFVMDPKETFLHSFQIQGRSSPEVTCRVLGEGEVLLEVSQPKIGLEKAKTGNYCRLGWQQEKAGVIKVIRKNLTDRKIRVYFMIASQDEER